MKDRIAFLGSTNSLFSNFYLVVAMVILRVGCSREVQIKDAEFPTFGNLGVGGRQ